jgi:hypothetical protein
MTMKFAAHGELQWSRAGSAFIPGGIATDPFGNVLVDGGYYNAQSLDFRTYIYDALGDETAGTIYDFNNGSYDVANLVTVDAAGSFVLSGDQGMVKYPALTPKAAYSSRTIGFDSIGISCSATKQVEVHNEGKSSLLISTVLADNSDIIVEPTDATILPSSSAVFDVTYSPSMAGPENGMLFFSTNAAPAEDSIAVAGVGSSSNSDIVIRNAVGKDWALVSMPVEPTGCGPQITSLFGYQGRYIPSGDVVNGRGYWGKARFGNVAFLGAPLTSITVDVDARWNLIGSISTPVLASGITSNPADNVSSQFYGYSPLRGYFAADTIEPGMGYWVKMKSVGQLTLANSGTAVSMSRPGRATGTRENFLLIKDASNRVQRLDLAESDRPIDLARFELPPPSPEGGFDVRFASGRMVEVMNGDATFKYPIVISGANFPVSISWQLEDLSGRTSLEIGGKLVPLSMVKGELVIEHATSVKVVPAALASLPKEFALLQNYPNPFNPTTVISYELPLSGQVVLKLFNILGQEIETLVDEQQAAGSKTVRVNGENLPSGVYMYRIVVGSFSDTKKMVLIR